MGKMIGEGASCQVRKAQDKRNGQSYAIKIIPRTQIEGYDIHLDLIENELKTLQEIQHSNMIKVHELLFDDQFYFIVSDLLKNGNLLDYIIYRRENSLGPLEEEDAKHVARQLFSFFQFLHSK